MGQTSPTRGVLPRDAAPLDSHMMLNGWSGRQSHLLSPQHAPPMRAWEYAPLGCRGFPGASVQAPPSGRSLAPGTGLGTPMSPVTSQSHLAVGAGAHVGMPSISALDALALPREHRPAWV